MAGRVLGRYEVLTQLASGGMAAVYVARAIGVAGFERLVAVKVLHPHLAYEEEFISMFLDEARLAARIRHPNVVPTLDISDSGGDGYFLVMEYIEGDHLGALLGRAAKQGRRLETNVAVRIVLDALGGLGAAHSLKDDKGEALNIVHRDVSPHNIMVGSDGISRLTDFGVAKAEVRMASTRAGQFKGKLSYMAPEQAATGEADQRSDLFSMGIILWESITGRRLFRGENNGATLSKIISEPIPLPSSFRPDLAPFDALLARALDRNADQRFQSADEFTEALEEVARQHGGVASTRAVGVLVTELVGTKLDEQRSRVQEAIESLGTREMGETLMPVARDGSSGSLLLPGSHARRTSIAPPRDGMSGLTPVSNGVQSLPPVGSAPVQESSGARGVKLLVVALLLIALVGGGLLAWKVANRPAPTAQPLRDTTIAPAATPPAAPSANSAGEAVGGPTEAQLAPEDANSDHGLAPALTDDTMPSEGAPDDGMTESSGTSRTSGRRPRGSTTAAGEPTTGTGDAQSAAPTPSPDPPASMMDAAPTPMSGFSFGTNPYLN